MTNLVRFWSATVLLPQWLTADEKPLAREQRTIAVVLGRNLPTRLLIWWSRLATASG